MRRITIREIAVRLRQAASARLDAWGWVRRRHERNAGDAFDGDLADAFSRCKTILLGGAFKSPDSLALLVDQKRIGPVKLLGIGPLDFGDPMDWHLDPIIGRRSPLLPWTMTVFETF